MSIRRSRMWATSGRLLRMFRAGMSGTQRITQGRAGEPMPTKATAKKDGHRPQRFTEEQVAQAVRDTRGIATAAASKLGCNPSTIYAYLKRYPDLDEVLSEARESALDFAESKLMDAIEDGNLTAIIFFLKTRGKSRGYSERPEYDPPDLGEFTITINDTIAERGREIESSVPIEDRGNGE